MSVIIIVTQPSENDGNWNFEVGFPLNISQQAFSNTARGGAMLAVAVARGPQLLQTAASATVWIGSRVGLLKI